MLQWKRRIHADINRFVIVTATAIVLVAAGNFGPIIWFWESILPVQRR